MPFEVKAAEEFIKEAKEKGKGRKFQQTVDLIFTLKDVDLKEQGKKIGGDVVLPSGRGRPVKICVIAGGDLGLRAKETGVGVLSREDIAAIGREKKKVKELARQYDFFVAQTDMMPLVGKTLGSVLGPRGKMPKPIPPNADVGAVVARLAKTVTVRTQREQPIINTIIGTEAMSDKELAANFAAVVDSVESTLPRGDQNLDSIIVKTTMGKPVRAL